MRERTFILDAEKTKPIREEWGSQAEIARKMGVSRHRLNSWLMGVNGISESYLHELCLLTNTRAIELISEESKKFFSNVLILA